MTLGTFSNWLHWLYADEVVTHLVMGKFAWTAIHAVSAPNGMPTELTRKDLLVRPTWAASWVRVQIRLNIFRLPMREAPWLALGLQKTLRRILYNWLLKIRPMQAMLWGTNTPMSLGYKARSERRITAMTIIDELQKTLVMLGWYLERRHVLGEKELSATLLMVLDAEGIAAEIEHDLENEEAAPPASFGLHRRPTNADGGPDADSPTGAIDW